MMKCGARGVPAPQVKWTKDSGVDFPAATERRITQHSMTQDSFLRDSKGTSFSSFEIRNISSVDMGVYTCNATNPAGSITWNITLSVLEIPR